MLSLSTQALGKLAVPCYSASHLTSLHSSQVHKPGEKHGGTSVRRSSPCNRKNDQDQTQLDQLGPDHVSIYGPVFFGLVASCPVFKKIIGPMKTQFTPVATGFSSKCELDHVSTHISINFRP